MRVAIVGGILSFFLLLLWWPRQHNPLLLILFTIHPGYPSQDVVVDIQLFIDAVEEGLAKRPALEIANGTV